MSTTEITRRPGTYALGHTPQEYERLRAGRDDQIDPKIAAAIG